jgi:beta-glucosidase
MAAGESMFHFGYKRRFKAFLQKKMTGVASPTMNFRKVEDAEFMGLPKNKAPVSDRVREILLHMSLDEKIDFIGGYKDLGIRAVPRLGLPSVWCSDATSGIRSFGTATAFPSNIAMTASWNRNLIRKAGEIIGEEARAKGVSILLGPGVNICRVPTSGRNFEYMGEDPFLAGEMVVPYIQGVQSRGVITTVKHFACNNSDYDRHRVSSDVDERTLREIYLPAFKAAVQRGKSGSIMNAYNPVNGVYSSENKYLLNDILRKEWGFDGFVISDWNSVYSTDGPIQAGLDLEMPKGLWINKKNVRHSLAEGTIAEADIDAMVGRLLTVLFRFGVYDRPQIDHKAQGSSAAHSKVALEVAREGIVLCKNGGNLLPLTRNAGKKIVVLGPMARDTPVGGGGSSLIGAPSEVCDLFTGISAAAGDGNSVVYLPLKRPNHLPRKAEELVRGADTVILCVGFSNIDESELYDKTWELPYGQDRLIRQVSRLNSRTVVALVTGSDCETDSWLPGVPVLLHTLYLGQAVGTAVGEVLFGQVNPSGKLPFTMSRNWNDIEAVKNYVKHPWTTTMARIGGPSRTLKPRKMGHWRYEEGIMVGYRHFDTAGIEPQFCFGHGLSYTSFEISGIKISSPVMKPDDILTVTARVRNTGTVAGAEVVQLYLSDPQASVKRPLRELKGFIKVDLKPGASSEVSFIIDKEALVFWDLARNRWVAEPGLFRVFVGSSSRDLAGEGEFTLEV